jgi:hypothetical protein
MLALGDLPDSLTKNALNRMTLSCSRSLIRQIRIMHILEEVTVVLNFAAEPAKRYDNDEKAVVIELDDAMSQHLAPAVSVPLKTWYGLHMVFLHPIELFGR